MRLGINIILSSDRPGDAEGLSPTVTKGTEAFKLTLVLHCIVKDLTAVVAQVGLSLVAGLNLVVVGLPNTVRSAGPVEESRERSSLPLHRHFQKIRPIPQQRPINPGRARRSLPLVRWSLRPRRLRARHRQNAHDPPLRPGRNPKIRQIGSRTLTPNRHDNRRLVMLGLLSPIGTASLPRLTHAWAPRPFLSQTKSAQRAQHDAPAICRNGRYGRAASFASA